MELELRNGLWLPKVDPYGMTLQWPSWNFSNAMFGGNFIEPAAKTSGPFVGPPVHCEQEILAWRRWDIEFDDDWKPCLASVSMTYQWTGPTMRTSKPLMHSSEGFWAVKSRREAYGYDNQAWGRVALSGTVVEGTEGYRAEVATVRAVWVQRKSKLDDPWILGMLSDRYQCPVRFYGEPEADEEDGP